MQKSIKIKAMDGSTVWLMENQISAIAEIPGSARTEGYTKIYIAGFEIKTKASCEELIRQIAESVKSFVD